MPRGSRTARFPDMLDPLLQARLAAVLPPAALLTTPEATRPYECDGLSAYRALPAAARGAGTSLSGGATPDAKGVVLSLAKFNRILSIDPVARTAVVQPGVR